MRLAFYKGKGNIFNTLIRWWTGSRYSHCEFVFSNYVWCGSDPRSGGVRYASIAPDESKWDFVHVNLDIFDENKLRRWCDCQVGKRYDWLGIALSQVFPFGGEDPGRYFCSEFCMAGLQQVGKFPRAIAAEVAPGGLAIRYHLE